MSFEFPFQDPDLPAEERIDDLLARLTLEEKIVCLSTNPTVPRLNLQGTGHVEGLHGLTLGGPGEWGRDHPVVTTVFPQAIGLAETWDPAVLKRVAAIEAIETRYAFQSPNYQRGALVVRAPNADLGRDPRWGRTEECYGEDAFFNATMACAFVKGLQGDDAKYWCTAALLKHFLANSNEEKRGSSSSDFDDALFREYYSLPFFRAITESGSRAFMAAYNKYNGVPCAVHPILKGIAVSEWGQDGIICTDGGAYKMLLTEHHYYPDKYEAAAACVRAGINQFLDDYKEGVTGAVERGLLSEAEIASSLRGVFRVMLRLGMLDPAERVPYARIGAAGEPEPWLSKAHGTAVREVTARSVVLLKNDAGLLPIAPSVKRIAVVGPFADRVHADWYGGTPPYVVTAIEGIRARAGADVELFTSSNNDTSELMHAARRAELVVILVGNHPTGEDGWAKSTQPSFGKEAIDRRSLTLETENLVQKVHKVNPNVVLVLVSSFPYAITWSQENVPAIVHLTHASQEFGSGLADVLFGDVDPGGRLVQTWPRALEDLPEMMDYDLRNGRTYMYSEKEPLYPFGFGLSYTRIEYRSATLADTRLELGGRLQLTITLENIGERRGDEVVQVYARFPASKLPRPKRKLCAFQRVTLEPGETRAVPIDVEARDLTHWDSQRQAFALEAGPLELLVARSAASVELSVAADIFS
ncbi:MAG TPA: glycoside hydrolase family 3 C-terminal domain-containing protein [Polyangiaceae bacterium]|jgi:beta-glucosidase